MTCDAFDLQVSVTTRGAPQTFTPDGSTNRISGVGYDAAGKQTTWNGGLYSYAWYPTGQLRQFTGQGRTTSYLYTAGGERIAWIDSSDGSTHYTLRDLAGNVLREYTKSGGVWTWRRDHVYRGGSPLAVIESDGTVKHIHTDHLGTVRRITNAAASIVTTRDYYPFGGFAANDDLTERKAFTGHERDHRDPAVTTDDLDYMHARTYSMHMARFLSADPLRGSPRRPQSFNLFGYVEANPVRYWDPFGLSAATYHLSQALADNITVIAEDPCPGVPRGFGCEQWRSIVGGLGRFFADSHSRRGTSDTWYAVGALGSGKEIIRGPYRYLITKAGDTHFGERHIHVFLRRTGRLLGRVSKTGEVITGDVPKSALKIGAKLGLWSTAIGFMLQASTAEAATLSDWAEAGAPGADLSPQEVILIYQLFSGQGDFALWPEGDSP